MSTKSTKQNYFIATDSKQYQELHEMAGDKPIVVDFSASWCGPCKTIGPVFESLSAKHPNMVFIKVDIDELESVADQAKVSSLPCFHIYKNSKLKGTLVGADSKKLTALIDEHNK